MDSNISKKQMAINDKKDRPLVLENQKSKCDQQRKEQIEDDDQGRNQTSLVESLKARVEKLETEFLVKNLDYKELREEFNNFKMLILESCNMNSMAFVQNNELIRENIIEINDIKIELNKIRAENDRLLEENILLNEMLSNMNSFSDNSINLENFDQTYIFEESIYSSCHTSEKEDYCEEKHNIYVDDDDNNSSMSFPFSRSYQNDDHDFENNVEHDGHDADVEKEVSGSSSTGLVEIKPLLSWCDFKGSDTSKNINKSNTSVNNEKTVDCTSVPPEKLAELLGMLNEAMVREGNENTKNLIVEHELIKLMKENAVKEEAKKLTVNKRQEQSIGKLNKGKTKYDPLYDPLLDSLKNVQDPAIDSGQKTTSSLNPYATSFFPGKGENLYSSNQERETLEIQRDLSINNIFSFLPDSSLNNPFYTPENVPLSSFPYDNFGQNHTNVVEEIHSRVQQTIDQYKLLNQKINLTSFRYLQYIFGIDDLMNYEKSKNFSSLLSSNHKKIIRKMIIALLKNELVTSNAFIRNIDEYKSRGLIPKLPKEFKSYNEYSKSGKCKKNRKIIKRLANEEKKNID